MNFVFSLQVNGTEVDTTNMDTNEVEEATRLFMDEFGWKNKLTPEQLEQTAVVLYDLEDKNPIIKRLRNYPLIIGTNVLDTYLEMKNEFTPKTAWRKSVHLHRDYFYQNKKFEKTFGDKLVSHNWEDLY